MYKYVFVYCILWTSLQIILTTKIINQSINQSSIPKLDAAVESMCVDKLILDCQNIYDLDVYYRGYRYRSQCASSLSGIYAISNNSRLKRIPRQQTAVLLLF